MSYEISYGNPDVLPTKHDGDSVTNTRSTEDVPTFLDEMHAEGFDPEYVFSETLDKISVEALRQAIISYNLSYNSTEHGRVCGVHVLGRLRKLRTASSVSSAHSSN